MKLGGVVGMAADENGGDAAGCMQYRIHGCTLMWEHLW